MVGVFGGVVVKVRAVDSRVVLGCDFEDSGVVLAGLVDSRVVLDIEIVESGVVLEWSG